MNRTFARAAALLAMAWASTSLAAPLQPLGNVTRCFQGSAALNDVAYFAGTDGTACALWRSDGTAEGTYLLKSVGTPSQITAAGGRLYFVVGFSALWQSDGTPDGTVPVLDGSGMPFKPTLWYEHALAGASDGVYFSDANGLWKTDGTSAGTVMLDAPPRITNGGPFTILGNSLIYTTADAIKRTDGTPQGTIVLGASSNATYYSTLKGDTTVSFVAEYYPNPSSIWRTDGTVAGTSKVRTNAQFKGPIGELGGRLYWVEDNYPQPNSTLFRLDAGQTAPVAFKANVHLRSVLGTVDGTRLIFAGLVDDGPLGIYSTDGTASGTVRIGDFGATIIDGVIAHRTMFYRDTHADTGKELWTGTGFAGGFTLVEDLAPGPTGSGPTPYTDTLDMVALSTGIFLFTGPGPDDKHAYFLPFDTTPDALAFAAREAVALAKPIVSDPVQVGGINVAVPVSATGGQFCVSAGSNCSCDIASYASSGFVSSGQSICVRHRSAATTLTTTMTNVLVGGVPAAFSSTTGAIATPRAGLAADLDADAFADLVWTHPSGASGAWLLDANGYHDANVVLPPAPGAIVVNTGDFDGDGRTDLLWRTGNGTYWLTLQDGLTTTASKKLLDGGTGWEVVAKGDFNGDGKTDLVWAGPGGDHRLALMDGTNDPAYPEIAPASARFSIALVADFDGDGKSDIVWTGADGSATMFLMDGTTIKEQKQLIGGGTGWTAAFSGDFDGDGEADLVWRHTDGRHGQWLMHGTSAWSYSTLVDAGTGWNLRFVRDLDGDAKSDLVWSPTDGSYAAWLMAGGAPKNYRQLLGAGSGWSIVASEDYDGDGKEDLLWRSSAGAYALWLMDGVDVKSYRNILDAGSGWEALP